MSHFHGGFYSTGSALYPDWFPQWLLDYCLVHSAIIVSGEYRLLPESSGSDIFDDVSDFYEWMRKELQPELSKLVPGIEADLSKVAVQGPSAGGTLAVQSGFFQPRGFIKAVIATFPGLNVGAKRNNPILGLPMVPPSVLEDHLKNMKPGTIVTSVESLERFQVALSIAQQTRTKDFYGSDEKLYPFKVLEKTENASYMLVLHGDNDTVVAVKGSIDFTEAMKNKFGDDNIDLVIRPGCEHGFDKDVALEEPWLKSALVKATELWLGASEA
ncbi:alpha/beta-hydrolase [Mollisia scopiformis]|uniref:Alpha/beta-hydrolase n=1 Tax=Mollisia scopiformis TaxID=149040 RepID=A0A194XSG8_MOLSC|nr:alpha/beta-hydrolase [Mollisia scopiformis]KUJ22984.1 alpha/beta-hydrolase [Mollisia scopiformis]